MPPNVSRYILPTDRFDGINGNSKCVPKLGVTVKLIKLLAAVNFITTSSYLR